MKVLLDSFFLSWKKGTFRMVNLLYVLLCPA